MTERVITSASNPRLKAVTALRRRRDRDESGTTLLDGLAELALALEAGVIPQTIFGCPELVPDLDLWQHVQHQATRLGTQLIRLSPAAFAKIAYREHPDGVVAIVATPGGGLDDLVPTSDPLLLVCERVEKPGNLGAMLRTADAVGLDGVIAADPVTDWGNPNVIRASKGTVFVVPVATASTSTALEWLERRGVALVAATPHATLDYTDADLTAPVAIAVGAEDEGLSDRLLDAATVRVRVPMAGRVNSLNVSTTAAILLYEALRQRRSLG